MEWHKLITNSALKFWLGGKEGVGGGGNKPRRLKQPLTQLRDNFF